MIQYGSHTWEEVRSKFGIENVLNGGRDRVLGEVGVWRCCTKWRAKDEGCLSEDILWTMGKLSFELVLSFASNTTKAHNANTAIVEETLNFFSISQTLFH